LLLGAVQLTDACPVAGVAVTPVGADGAVGASGATAFDCVETGPDPFGFAACTLKVYVVPGLRPATVMLVAGGFPVRVEAVWAVEPTYGVTVYVVTGPPLDGADQLTVAEL
jgi:hypothetical protein